MPVDTVRRRALSKIDATEALEVACAKDIDRRPTIAGERHILAIGRCREFVGVGAAV